MLVADDGDTEANISLPFFFSINVFLLAAGVDRVFATWGFTVVALLLNDTLLLLQEVILFPVCRFS